jgi:hypothetical protein
VRNNRAKYLSLNGIHKIQGVETAYAKPAKTVYITQKSRIYIQFNGKDSSDDKSVKSAIHGTGSQDGGRRCKVKRCRIFPDMSSMQKHFFVLHPRFPHLFGEVLVFPYQIENSRPVLRQYRFAGVLLSLYRRGLAILQKNYRFPGAEWMAYSFIV